METGRIELAANYYDKVFKESQHFICHYAASHYYPLIVKAGNLINPKDRILELGCGTGQMAHFLWDIGRVNYLGIDISSEGIRQARQRSPQIFKLTSVYQQWEGYDVILVMEVLEHINDLLLLDLIEHGTRIIGTLPDFEEEVSHLRYFKTEAEIRERYSGRIKINHIEKIGRWWLFEAVR